MIWAGRSIEVRESARVVLGDMTSQQMGVVRCSLDSCLLLSSFFAFQVFSSPRMSLAHKASPQHPPQKVRAISALKLPSLNTDLYWLPTGAGANRLDGRGGGNGAGPGATFFKALVYHHYYYYYNYYSVLSSFLLLRGKGGIGERSRLLRELPRTLFSFILLIVVIFFMVLFYFKHMLSIIFLYSFFLFFFLLSNSCFFLDL